jgi:hypothetical protein
MSRPLRVLCLFSSPELEARSFFGPLHGNWASDIEQGRCEFVPLVLDAEVATLASSGLFAAVSLIVQPSDLGAERAGLLRRGAAAFAAAGIPCEVIAVDSPVELLSWMSSAAPELARLCRQDGETRIDSPSWWRGRARRHLAREADPQSLAPDEGDEGEALRSFMSRRWR